MISVLIVHPSFMPLFAVPTWIVPVLLVGGLAISAILSGWLSRHQRIQTYVTAFVLASLLAGAIYTASQRPPVAVQHAILVICGGWYWSIMCWL